MVEQARGDPREGHPRERPFASVTIVNKFSCLFGAQHPSRSEITV